MKTVFKIARTELRILFYSPIAWFLMIVFLIQCGVTYLTLLESVARQQETGGAGLLYLTRLTERIFSSPFGLFASIMQKLYLFIPLLTMGLISRETGSGTIKLLYSSPIQVQTIVFGKFLAMMIYSLLLVAIIGIFLVLGMNNIIFPEGGILLSSVLGFYLLLCAYSAIGLFMSCLTTYQVVAALSTFVMIGVLSYIGTVWQGIDFVRDLTYFLSISGRAEKMLSGLITSRDIIYFILIIYIFLALSIYKLKAGMESATMLVKASRYIAVIASGLFIGYVSSRPGLIAYYDATLNKTRTITPQVQSIIKELGDEPLEVTTYNNLLGNYRYLGMPEQRNADLARWELYMRFKSNIKLNYVQYYDTPLDAPFPMRQYPDKSLKEIAEQYAKTSRSKLSDYKSPEEIKKIANLEPELNRYVMQLKYKNRTTFLRIYNDMMLWPSETEVAAAFKRLLQAKLPRIGFLAGDLERDINKRGDREYKTVTNLKTFRNSLINQGFDVYTLLLENQEIPADVTTLVIADPKIALTPVTMAELQRYLDSGGNMMIAGEPNKQALLNPFLEQMGVQLMDGMVVQESRDFSPDMATPMLTPFAVPLAPILAKSAADSQHLSMPGAAALSYTTGGAYTIHPLLTTDAKRSWNKKAKPDLEMVTGADAGRGRMIPGAGTVTFSEADGDTRGPITTAVSLTRQVNGKEQRIVVLGDADFMSNSELQRNNIRTANFVFNIGLFSWLNYGTFPIDTQRPDPKDKRVTVTMDQVDNMRIVLIWIVPAILLAFAAILLIRRKRK